MLIKICFSFTGNLTSNQHDNITNSKQGKLEGGLYPREAYNWMSFLAHLAVDGPITGGRGGGGPSGLF